MTRAPVYVVFTLLTLTCSVGANDKEVIRANNEFAARFYEVLSWNTDEDFIFCPFCISTSMAMLTLGSSGETTKDIQYILGFPDNVTAVMESYQRLVQEFGQQVKPTRSMFNGIFVSKSVVVNPEFESNLDRYFNSEIYYMDMDKKKNAQILKVVREKLNRTSSNGDDSDDDDEHGIRNKRGITSYTADSTNDIIMVNYFDFKAGWEKKFDFINTRPAPFYVNGSEILTVNTMRQTGHYYITPLPELDAQAIAIPYLLCDGLQIKASQQMNRTQRLKPRNKKSCKSGVKDSRLQMIIVLPNSQNGLMAMERKLTRQSLLTIPSKFDYKSYLDLRLPSFKMSSKKDEAYVSSMLLPSDDQDFSNISKTSSLRFGQTFHRVTVNVNERGSRTKSSLLKGSNPWSQPKIVRIDHPFLAFIHDKKTDVILVVLRVVRPKAKE